MWVDSSLTQQLVMERMKDMQREAERNRLTEKAGGPKRARGWWRLVMLMLGSLLSFVIRPQS